MSDRELHRIVVLAQVLDGSLRTATAAKLLGLGRRQVQRLLVRQVQNEGAKPCVTSCAAGPRTTASAI